MDNDKLIMLKATFKNNNNNEMVNGITVMIDGKIKQAFDLILKNSDEYNEYSEILRDCIFLGTTEIIKKDKKE